jgi:hypothetical protein
MQFLCNECDGAELTQKATCNINTDEIMNYEDAAVWCEDCNKYVETKTIEMRSMTTGGYISRIIDAEKILDCITDDVNPSFLYNIIKEYNTKYNR